MTTSIVLLVLALGWVAYLAIWWKDSRKTAATRANTMSSFAGGMDSLGGSTARTAPMLGGRPTGLKPQSSVAVSQAAAAGQRSSRSWRIMMRIARWGSTTMISSRNPSTRRW